MKTLYFITGTSSGIGYALTNHILSTENDVLVEGISRTQAIHHSNYKHHTFDLSEIDNLIGFFGKIDLQRRIKSKIDKVVLINNAGTLGEVGYVGKIPSEDIIKTMNINTIAPFVLMNQKVHQIIEDLKIIQNEFSDFISTQSKVFLSNSMEYDHSNKFDLIITSPPYMNGLDYVINYKIEMGWLNFAKNQTELKKVKDEMVVCDNVSKGLIRNFHPIYTNDWIDDIKRNIQGNILRRGKYRRLDMPFIVHKYFDDMYKVFKMVIPKIKNDGRFILVVGDSLIADVYVPTDLLIAQIGKDLGLSIEKIEKARNRRSGQIRSYKLRETIITLRK